MEKGTSWACLQPLVVLGMVQKTVDEERETRPVKEEDVRSGGTSWESRQETNVRVAPRIAAAVADQVAKVLEPHPAIGKARHL